MAKGEGSLPEDSRELIHNSVIFDGKIIDGPWENKMGKDRAVDLVVCHLAYRRRGEDVVLRRVNPKVHVLYRTDDINMAKYVAAQATRRRRARIVGRLVYDSNLRETIIEAHSVSFLHDD
jgi:hypothetical protein